MPQHSVAERPATRAVVVDFDEDAGERQPAVRARDAGELLQREPPFAGEAELHHARRGELAVRVDAGDEQPFTAAAAAGIIHHPADGVSGLGCCCEPSRALVGGAAAAADYGLNLVPATLRESRHRAGLNVGAGAV